MVRGSAEVAEKGGACSLPEVGEGVRCPLNAEEWRGCQEARGSAEEAEKRAQCDRTGPVH